MQHPNSLGKDNYSCLISQRGNQAPEDEVFWDQPPPALPPNTIFLLITPLCIEQYLKQRRRTLASHFSAKELRKLGPERRFAWPLSQLLLQDLWVAKLGFLYCTLIYPQFSIFICMCTHTSVHHHVHTSTTCIQEPIHTCMYVYMLTYIYVVYIIYNLLIGNMIKTFSQLRVPLSRYL